jgi:hypothetical protein
MKDKGYTTSMRKWQTKPEFTPSNRGKETFLAWDV